MEELKVLPITPRLTVKALWDKEFDLGLVELIDDMVSAPMDFMGVYLTQHATITAAERLAQGIGHALAAPNYE